MSRQEAVVLYSGGTDSTCAAALLLERGLCVHLLTLTEAATEDSPVPTRNAERLRDRFGRESVGHSVSRIDALLRELSYGDYLGSMRRHGLFVLSAPGLSALSWHVRAVALCLERGIGRVADGLTRELMHFPGHRDAVLAEFRALYRRYGIEYENPVRDWPVPPDRQFTDGLIVGRHGFLAPGESHPARTTGRYLHEIGLFDRPDLKGTDEDRAMQHDCYPFVLFNILVFWTYLPFRSLEEYDARLVAFFREKCAAAAALLDEHRGTGGRGRLAALLDR